MDAGDVRLDVGGERVFERADGLASAILVLEKRVVGTQERVRLSDGDVDGEPVARWRGVGGTQAMLLQPGRHTCHSVRRRCDQGSDLEGQLNRC